MKTLGERNHALDYKKRIGAYGIIKNSENKYLVVEDEDENLYLIGGGSEQNESPEDTLQREAIEEVGYSVEIKAYLGKAEKHWVSSKYPEWSQHNIGYFFKCELNEKVAEPIESEKMKWVTFNELEEKLFHEHHLYMLKKSFIV